MKKVLLLGSIIASLSIVSAAEARGSLPERRPAPTKKELEDARWIKLKVERCAARTQANEEKLWRGGEPIGYNKSDDDYERICLVLISMQR